MSGRPAGTCLPLPTRDRITECAFGSYPDDRRRHVYGGLPPSLTAIATPEAAGIAGAGSGRGDAITRTAFREGPMKHLIRVVALAATVAASGPVV
jgi:hypothetical protein